MHDVGWLASEDYKKALAEPLRLNPNQRETFAFRADYVAEMARRAAIVEQYGESAVRGRPAGCTPPCAARTRRRPTSDCGRGSSSTTAATVNHGPEGFVNLPAAGRRRGRGPWRTRCRTARSSTSSCRPVVVEASAKEVKVMMRRGRRGLGERRGG